MTLISITLAVLFTGTATWVRKELPESISSLVYLLPPVGRWVWTVWLWAVALTACMPLIDAMPENVKFLGFLTMGCLLFCGAMPIFMEDKRKVHNIFGIAAGAFSQVAVAFLSPWWLFLWLLFAMLLADAYVGGKKRWYAGKEVFIAEMLCWLTVTGSVLTA